MADITCLPVMTAADAESIGFARFNNVPTLPIDIPAGNFTITARTSDGRRITFFFGEHRRGSPPGFVDIQFHDHDATIPNADRGRSPVCAMLPIGRGGRQVFDSRKLEIDDKPSIAVILPGEPPVGSPSDKQS